MKIRLINHNLSKSKKKDKMNAKRLEKYLNHDIINMEGVAPKDLKKSRAGLVKVMVNVNGQHGQYQAYRWKKPKAAMGVLKQALKQQGVDIASVTFKNKKTGETHDFDDITKNYFKNGKEQTIQDFVKKNYDLSKDGSKEAPKTTKQGGNDGGGGGDEKFMAKVIKLIESTETNTSDSDGKDSLKKHTGADGKLTPEREKLHREIILDHFKGKKPVEGQGTYIIMGGGSASGKGHVIKAGVITIPEGTVSIDSDDIKTRIPEYNDMLKGTEKEAEEAAGYAHEESSALAKRIQSMSLQLNYNTLLDGTGNGSDNSLLSKIEEGRSHGFKIVGEYVTIPTEEALIRAEKRAKRTGRKIREEVIKNIHKRVTQKALKFAELFDEIRVYDNTDAPKLIAEGGDGKKLMPLKGEEESFGAFLRKGDE